MGLERGSAPERRFGHYLRRLREQRKLTLEAAQDLSATFRTRLTSSYLSRLESGLATPNLDRLSALSRVYDIPMTTLVEKFQIEQRRDGRLEQDLPTEFDALRKMLRRLLHSGAYLEVLRVCAAARQRLDEDPELAERYTVDGERHLRLLECQAMVHLELYETAKFETEKLLELDGLTVEHRLAAWQYFIGCCNRLGRFKLALAALDQAEREADVDDAPARTRPDLLMQRGNVLTVLRRFDEAAVCYAEALKRYDEQGNRVESCRTRINLGGVRVALGKLNAAQRTLVAATEEAERAGYEQLRAYGLAHLSALAWHQGDSARVEGYAYRAIQVARRLGLASVEFKSRYYLMLAADSEGDRHASEAYARLLRRQLDHALPPMPEIDDFLARRSVEGDGDGR